MEEGFERVLVILKPDAFQHVNLHGNNHNFRQEDILNRYINRGLVLEKSCTYRAIFKEDKEPRKVRLTQHYAEHEGKPFYPPLIEFMMCGSISVCIFKGPNAVRVARALNGATNPLDAAPGTIRGDYGTVLPRNVVHASDSVESAEREIAIWFG